MKQAKSNQRKQQLILVRQLRKKLKIFLNTVRLVDSAGYRNSYYKVVG